VTRTPYEFAQAVATLAERDCLDLLASCQDASLAYTDRARPAVIPVAVAVAGDELRVALPLHCDTHRFAGQVVALGASVSAAPGGEGWWVVVRGTLSQLRSDRVLLLEPMEIEGRLLASAPRRRWWR
jgi:hypothetical protein